MGQQKFRISPEQPREGRSTIVHIPPPFPSLPSIVSEQCPRWYQLHLSTKWIRGQRQSAKSAISKALKKHTRLGIREQERALQFVHRHWSKQPKSCTDGQCGGKAGHLDFKSMAQVEEICSTLMLTTTTPSSSLCRAFSWS